MNAVDAVFLLILVLAVLRGYAKGLLATLAGYVAPVAGFMLAADFSDPVRDRIGQMVAMPDIALDLVAPVAVFVAVVLAAKILVALLSQLLGIGLSLPSRLLASAAGAAVSGLVLGCLVVLVHEMRPQRPAAPVSDADEAGRAIVGPVDKLLIDLDRRLTESLMAPPLADLASAVVSEAILPGEGATLIQREDVEAAARSAAATAAAASIGALPVSDPAGGPGEGAGR